VLVVLLAAVGAQGISVSARHEPWQRFGALIAFTIAGPIYMRLASVRLRSPQVGPPENTKRGLGEVLVEWGPAVLTAILALVFWLSMLTA
jgi:hypothetical protein